MIDVVVEVRGGLVAEVYCGNPGVRVIVIDWDELDSPERGGKVGFEWSDHLRIDALPDDTRAQYVAAVEDGVECR
ncbi:unnamed protein product [marine sediment metagenome]|uniref:Uncharacterized protein n=1 Tax=marine sediment metagenome TaxID=412755 RepID=X0V6G4_9ZZZZ